GLAVRLSRTPANVGSALGRRAAPPSRRERVAEGRQAGDTQGWYREAGELSHAAPLIRYAPARARHGHPHGSGAAGPQRRSHDANLYARAEARRFGGLESARRRVGSQGP